MREITVKLYQYQELNSEAKEKARQWWREASAGDNYFSEAMVEEFADTLKACGFDVRTRRGTHAESAIFWGTNPAEGAFDATWAARDVNVAALIADRPLTYKDADGKEQRSKHNAELVPILERVAALATEMPHSYGTVDTTPRMGLACDWDSGDEESPDDTDIELRYEFRSIAEDLAHYLGWTVQEDMEYQDSDEQIAETIITNEYEFTEDGERA